MNSEPLGNIKPVSIRTLDEIKSLCRIGTAILNQSPYKTSTPIKLCNIVTHVKSGCLSIFKKNGPPHLFDTPRLFDTREYIKSEPLREGKNIRVHRPRLWDFWVTKKSLPPVFKCQRKMSFPLFKHLKKSLIPLFINHKKVHSLFFKVRNEGPNPSP